MRKVNSTGGWGCNWATLARERCPAKTRSAGGGGLEQGDGQRRHSHSKTVELKYSNHNKLYGNQGKR